MNHEDYEKAANYWKEKDADNVCMPDMFSEGGENFMH